VGATGINSNTLSAANANAMLQQYQSRTGSPGTANAGRTLAVFGSGIMGFGVAATSPINAGSLTSRSGSPVNFGPSTGGSVFAPLDGPGSFNASASSSASGRPLSRALSPVTRAGIPVAVANNRPPSPPPRGASLSPRRNPANSDFRGFHARQLLPVRLEHQRHGAPLPRLQWLNGGIQAVDLKRWLPIFFDGLRDLDYPFSFISMQGISELLEFAGPRGLVGPLLPFLVPLLKIALNTRRVPVMLRAMDTLRMLVLCDTTAPAESGYRGQIGRALVAYYRTLLPVFNIFLLQQRNLGDRIDYGQRHDACIGDRILELLNLLELHGGKDAFLNVKYMIPSYQSVRPSANNTTVNLSGTASLASVPTGSPLVARPASPLFGGGPPSPRSTGFSASGVGFPITPSVNSFSLGGR
jgi:hypothetical protein